MPILFDGVNDNAMSNQDAITGVDTDVTTSAGFIYVNGPIGSVRTVFSVSDNAAPTGTIVREMKVGQPISSGHVFRFRHSFSTQIGNWRTGDFDTDNWHQFVVIYDASSVSNNPIFYVDNISVSVTKIASAIGTRSIGFDTIVFGQAPTVNAEYFSGETAFACLDAGLSWDAFQVNRHYWYGNPGGTMKINYPLVTTDLSNKGSIANAPLTLNNGAQAVSSITNAHKGFVLLRSCT